MAGMSGGDKLMARLKQIADRLSSATEVDVGFLEGRTYPDGTPIAMVAAIQEFGAPTKNIPPRPFFRGMIAANAPDWGKQMAAIVKANDYDAETALKAMGSEVKNQLQDSIDDTNDPPNAPATIKAKGAAKPLVDTGQMRQSIDYIVR